MGIRESLLNTITSVADSDFVRIVTAAGASSKATVRNLFKGFESNLSAKSSLTTSDYIRVVGSDNEAYKQSISDAADVIIPTTAKRFADGADASAQSVYGLYYCGSWTNAPSSAPAAGYLLVLPHGASATNYRKQIYSPYNNNNLFIRTMNGGSWSAWEKLPTRAEIDTLNSNKGSIACSISSTLISWRKSGKWVSLIFDGVINAQIPANAYTTLGTLPSGMLPNAYVIADALRSRVDNRLLVEVQTSGVIRCYNYGTALASGTSVRFNIMYLLA